MYTDAFQSELRAGESILWTGRPERKVIFHREDWYLIPFSLMWGGFAIFWEASVLGITFLKGQSAPWFFVLWGIPFVVIGQYVIWGRFLHAAWKKKRTFYALTNKRALLIKPKFSGTNVISINLRHISAVEKSVRRDGIGRITLGPASPMDSWRSAGNWGVWTNDKVTPTFMDISDAERVHDLLLRAIEKDPQREAVFGFNR